MAKNDILDHPDLRKVWNALESESPSIEWERLTSTRPAPGRPQPRGQWVALAAFLIVLGIGGIALLNRGGSSEPGGLIANLDWDLVVTLAARDDPDTLVADVEGIEGVSGVEYYPVASVLYSPPPVTESTDDVVVTTVRSPSGTIGEEPVTAALLVLLDDPANAEPVAHEINQTFQPYAVEYSSDLSPMIADGYFEFLERGATVIGDDPLTYQAAPGPEPQFDTSGLGTEVALSPATDASEIPEMFWEFSTMTIFEDIDVRSSDSPVYHIGYLYETDARMVVYRSVVGNRCADVLETEGGVGGGCGDRTARYPYGVWGYGGNEGETANLRVEVPPATSVVAVTIDGGQPMWQRPVAGLALFPALIEDYDFARFTVDAYDASGSILGHWEQ